MSQPSPSGPFQKITELEQLGRREPLPNLTEALQGQELPTEGAAPSPLADLMPPIAEMPKVSSSKFYPASQKTAEFSPGPKVKALVDKIAANIEESPIASPSEPKSGDASVLENTPALCSLETDPPESKDTFTQPAGPDADLIEAMLPIVESSLEKAHDNPKTGLHAHLEPMLRNTVRRAIAEQMQTSRHFGSISTVDRLTWRMKALFSSQTYDDIIFERTQRYQVEEVFLMRYHTHSLISFASHDPSRHANPKKIRYDVSQLIGELKGADGELRETFDLPEHRIALTRQGRHCFLLAVIRGRANTLVHADLDYTLEQVEQRFEKRLRKEGHDFLHLLQPHLEGCLLIQSLPAPR